MEFDSFDHIVGIPHLSMCSSSTFLQHAYDASAAASSIEVLVPAIIIHPTTISHPRRMPLHSSQRRQRPAMNCIIQRNGSARGSQRPCFIGTDECSLPTSRIWWMRAPEPAKAARRILQLRRSISSHQAHQAAVDALHPPSLWSNPCLPYELLIRLTKHRSPRCYI